MFSVIDKEGTTWEWTYPIKHLQSVRDLQDIYKTGNPYLITEMQTVWFSSLVLSVWMFVICNFEVGMRHGDPGCSDSVQLRLSFARSSSLVSEWECEGRNGYQVSTLRQLLTQAVLSIHLQMQPKPSHSLETPSENTVRNLSNILSNHSPSKLLLLRPASGETYGRALVGLS
jgi:hypothetical protein